MSKSKENKTMVEARKKYHRKKKVKCTLDSMLGTGDQLRDRDVTKEDREKKYKVKRKQCIKLKK
jgi:hypothetical protein